MKKALVASLLFSCLSFSSLAVQAAESMAPTALPAASQAEVTGLIDVNSADAATLQRELVGIGAVKAQAIVDYRQAHGAFQSVEELLEVKGIGVATLEKNRARLSVSP